MKKVLAIVLIVAVCIGLLPMSVLAEPAKFVYDDAMVQDLYVDFNELSRVFEDQFFQKDDFAYWNYAEQMESVGLFTWLMDAGSVVLGEATDEKYYTQVLANMIALLETDMAQQLESQSQYDNMKNAEEYVLDLVDIGATVIGLQGKVKDLEKVITTLEDSIDVLVKSVDDLQYYELAVRNYANAETFLKAVSEYSDNQAMKDAASEMRAANELLLKERVKCISSLAGNLGEFSIKNFMNDLSFSLLKNTNDYKTDKFIKEYVDFAEGAMSQFANQISKGQAAFKTIILGGDFLIGVTNTFRRHNEILAMADIAEALIAASNDISVSASAPSQTIYSNVRAKSEYYKMLLAVHLRGEYLIYRFTQKDTGVIAFINSWIDNNLRKKDETVTHWFNTQTDNCEEYYHLLNDLFSPFGQEQGNVKGGFELYDGFIVEVQKQTSVPEGYYGIYSFQDFQKIADSCPAGKTYEKTEWNTANYILMNDITFPSDYVGVGAFYGTLDGNGYTMHNVGRPLFNGVGGATVKNLGIQANYNVDLEDNTYRYGAIAMNGMFDVDEDFGVTIFDNCFVTGKINISCRSGEFGGLIGDSTGVDISHCYNEADISIKTRQGGSLGGICGSQSDVFMLSGCDGYQCLIENCYNAGSLSIYASCEMTFYAVSIDLYAGGIAAQNSNGDIKKCYNTGAVKATSAIGCQVYTGGICAYHLDQNLDLEYASGFVQNCYNIGQVTNECQEAFKADAKFGEFYEPAYYSGGIIGYAVGRERLNCNKCWNSGNISSENFAGGVIGSSECSEGISNCYNIGTVSAPVLAGGILGQDLFETKITCCYNTGIVTGGGKCGALAGESLNAEELLVNCYYLSNGIGATAMGTQYSGVKALSAAQLTDRYAFKGFDFLRIWKIRNGDLTPQLK